MGGSARWLFALTCLSLACSPERVAAVSPPVRAERTVEQPWRVIVHDAGVPERAGEGVDEAAARPGFDDSHWARVAVPDNRQGYSYDHQTVRGARHGTAWYRTHLTLTAPAGDRRTFLMFEGVNSYATVWLNGRPVGRHAGGLTSFTLDVTGAVRTGDNLLAVRVDNPAGITDLPWVSGDDQLQNGFAEGSQPFGIFRPVHVIETASLRIRPFGLYAWGGEGAYVDHPATIGAHVLDEPNRQLLR